MRTYPRTATGVSAAFPRDAAYADATDGDAERVFAANSFDRFLQRLEPALDFIADRWFWLVGAVLLAGVVVRGLRDTGAL